MAGQMKINKNLLKRFAQKFNISMLILFGSAAVPDSGKKPGDFDIALFAPVKKIKKYEEDMNVYTELMNDLAAVLNISADKLDIVFVSSKTPPLLLYHIAKDGKMIYGNNIDFSLFRIKAVKIFFDTRLFRNILDKYLHQTFHVGQTTH